MVDLRAYRDEMAVDMKVVRMAKNMEVILNSNRFRSKKSYD